MSMDFTKDRLEMEAREAKVRDWLDKLDAERKAEQAALDAAVAAEQARLAAKEAFSKAKEAILGETEFAGYGFTYEPKPDVSAVAFVADKPLPEGNSRAATDDTFRELASNARLVREEPNGDRVFEIDITEAVKSIADAPPEAPDASDEPEMGCDEAEAVEAVLSDLEGAQ